MRIAIMVDGGFLISAARQSNNRWEDQSMAKQIHQWLSKDLPRTVKTLAGQDIFLFRIYYYDCYPFKGKIVNPYTDISKTMGDTNRTYFLNELGKQQGMCMRLGRLQMVGWKIKDLKGRVSKGNVSGEDIEPSFIQKGVDTRFTLDVSLLAQNKTVDGFVFITGDSDFAPLMEFIRQQGLLVYLCTLGRYISQELLVAADRLVETEYDLGDGNEMAFSGSKLPNFNSALK